MTTMHNNDCHRLLAAFATALVATAAFIASAKEVSPIEIGSRLELFVDRHLIDGLDGAALELHSATLGLFEFQGSKDNNIIWRNESTGEFEGYSSCFMVSLNANPAAKPGERYIAIAHSQREGTTPNGDPIGKHAIFTSPDGHRFTRKPTPVMERPRSDAGGDVVFWDTNLATYVAYLRAYYDAETGTLGGYKAKGVRSQVRMTSPDLEHWSEPEVVNYGDAPAEDLYTMMPEQYPRAPHLYVGMPTRFMPKRKAVKEWWRDGVNDGVFVTSRGGLRWDRTFLEAFVRLRFVLKDADVYALQFRK